MKMAIQDKEATKLPPRCGFAEAASEFATDAAGQQTTTDDTAE